MIIIMRNRIKILICGATGFIGKNLALNLSKNKNYKIYGTFNKSKKYGNKNINWIKADLTNPIITNKITKNKDIIIQAAATTSGADDIINRPYLHVADNAVMNSHLLRSSYINKIKHFIFFSCTVMYNSSDKKIKESHFNPSKELYPKYFGVAKTKIYVEDLCKFYSSISDTKYTCIRHSNVYGPHDKYDLIKSHFFGATIRKVLEAKDNIQIWGKGSEKRDLLYIDDLVSFVNLCIKKQKNKFDIYNCGLGKSYSVNSVVRKIVKISSRKLKINNDLTKKSIETKVALDCTKAKLELNWKAKTTLSDGIKKTLNWYNKTIISQ